MNPLCNGVHLAFSSATVEHNKCNESDVHGPKSQACMLPAAAKISISGSGNPRQSERETADSETLHIQDHFHLKSASRSIHFKGFLNYQLLEIGLANCVWDNGLLQSDMDTLFLSLSHTHRHNAVFSQPKKHVAYEQKHWWRASVLLSDYQEQLSKRK